MGGAEVRFGVFPQKGESHSVRLCDRCQWGHVEGSSGRGPMRPWPPQGTHLMGVEINNGGPGDALHTLKQKLPGRRRET